MPSMGTSFDMMPASRWSELERDVGRRMREAGHEETIVSIAFATPYSVVFNDLKRNFAYLNIRSGTAWDLYFAGYGGARWGQFPEPRTSRGSAEFYSPSRFNDLRIAVSGRHRQALEQAPEVPAGTPPPWRYTGQCDLVSLMAYPGDMDAPVKWDWLSLRGVTMTDAKGAYTVHGLPEIVEDLSDWRMEPEPPSLSRFAPGEDRNTNTTTTSSLGAALTALSLTVAGGVATSAVYDLLKLLT
ncbi:hypothetical protein JHN52_00425 [Streptomyces sp. MBT97]|uniref:hypothetical protein n=1 Tax=Streptomyces sp. MBT97 TaxID=2800411 RepID=UPI00190AC61B|nr:hypothetical protein [Streptomyces sp. MBT97]MBK3631446.1 hypothetical protein [Streptomyces sp. MBT97]